ncbi:hypothetical protein PLICRDRAFT_280907 [Plicaturopsis crispa FD-325 SS-3]|nr:hypothetical protein PLICRDRAFT_280907 [Plicaturopsis crispa FD-325 SS-3]
MSAPYFGAYEQRVLMDHDILAKRLKNNRLPVSRLPPETLGSVFASLHDSSWFWLRGGKSGLFPVVVSHVSHFWRTTAIGTPQLWNRVPVRDWVNKELLDLFLKRSRALPLTVRDTSSREDLFTKLIEHVERWSVVTIRTNKPNDILPRMIPLRAPILRSLEIALPNDGYEHIYQPSLHLFSSGASMLSVLRLTDLSVKSCVINLSAMRDLDITSSRTTSTTEMLSALKQAPLLTRLRLFYSSVYHSPSAPLPAVTLPLLTSLAISFVDGNNLPPFLRSLDTPSLKTLQIAEREEGSSPSSDFARDDQGNSRYPALKTLHLDGMILDLHFLHGLDEVTDLVHNYRVMGTDIMFALLGTTASASPTGLLLPGLRKVTLIHNMGSRITRGSRRDPNASLRGMVASREQTNHPLTEVRVVSPPNEVYDTDALRWLREHLNVVMEES